MDKPGDRFCIYIHRRPDTGVIFYVGIGVSQRPYVNKYRNNLWHKIVRKNNGDFIVEIIGENLSWEFCCAVEMGLIKTYGRINNRTGILCNMTDGGDGVTGIIHSKETREKIRKTLTGNKMSLSARQKMSIAGKGRKKSEEHIRKIGDGRKGKLHTVESKKYMAINRTKGLFIEQICIETGVVINSFLNVTIAQKVTGVDDTLIGYVLRGKRLQAGGFFWRKAEDNTTWDFLVSEFLSA